MTTMNLRHAWVLALGVLWACQLPPDLLEAGNADESDTSGDGGTSSESDSSGDGDTADELNLAAEETGPGEITCRDALECIVGCQTELIFNPQPDPDLSCFLECDMGLSSEEAHKLIELGECINNKCATDPDGAGPMLAPCESESENNDHDCLVCVVANGQDPQPSGCIEEAAACQ
jgi:hypothetical protein